MNIVITGASGLVGKALSAKLQADNHTVRTLTRGAGDAARGIYNWDPASRSIDEAALAGVDAAVHLAGENIADGRWNEQKKARIRDSRVMGTRMLAEALARQEPRPQTLICASAIGFYGDRGDETLTEDALPGTGYLPDVCQAWEAAAAPAEECGIRVVYLRIGVVLSQQGGALAKMLTPFKLGVGGVLGNGKQYMSWIDLDDLVGIIRYALDHDTVRGPVNAVAPTPVTNREFTKTLGRVLRRPTIAPMPGFAARLAFGEMADTLLLASTKVIPEQLNQNGFTFTYPRLEASLRNQLAR